MSNNLRAERSRPTSHTALFAETNMRPSALNVMPSADVNGSSTKISGVTGKVGPSSVCAEAKPTPATASATPIMQRFVAVSPIGNGAVSAAIRGHNVEDRIDVGGAHVEMRGESNPALVALCPYADFPSPEVLL